MVKDAYLQWNNIFSGSNLIFGLSPTPAFDVSEGALRVIVIWKKLLWISTVSYLHAI